MFEDFVNFLIDQFYFIIINTKQLIIRIHTIVMLNKLIIFESNIINCFTTMIRLALKFLETELCWNETILLLHLVKSAIYTQDGKTRKISAVHKLFHKRFPRVKSAI